MSKTIENDVMRALLADALTLRSLHTAALNAKGDILGRQSCSRQAAQIENRLREALMLPGRFAYLTHNMAAIEVMAPDICLCGSSMHDGYCTVNDCIASKTRAVKEAGEENDNGD